MAPDAEHRRHPVLKGVVIAIIAIVLIVTVVGSALLAYVSITSPSTQDAEQPAEQP